MSQFRDETVSDADEIDWRKYDPCREGPRRIVREAMEETLDDLRSPTGTWRIAEQLGLYPEAWHSTFAVSA